MLRRACRSGAQRSVADGKGRSGSQKSFANSTVRATRLRTAEECGLSIANGYRLGKTGDTARATDFPRAAATDRLDHRQ
jgi:hypothetical protein